MYEIQALGPGLPPRATRPPAAPWRAAVSLVTRTGLPLGAHTSWTHGALPAAHCVRVRRKGQAGDRPWATPEAGTPWELTNVSCCKMRHVFGRRGLIPHEGGGGERVAPLNWLVRNPPVFGCHCRHPRWPTNGVSGVVHSQGWQQRDLALPRAPPRGRRPVSAGGSDAACGAWQLLDCRRRRASRIRLPVGGGEPARGGSYETPRVVAYCAGSRVWGAAACAAARPGRPFRGP